MRYVLAFFFPWITFFTIGKVGRGIICLLLQLTLIGWLPAVIWAVASVSAFNADKRTDRVVEAMQRSTTAPKVEPKLREIPEHVAAPLMQTAPRPSPTVESYFRSKPREQPTPNRFADADVSTSPSERPPSRSYDERKWRALLRFDEDIAAAATRARSYGARWEDELARSYLLLNDKGYLVAILDKVTKEAQTQNA